MKDTEQPWLVNGFRGTWAISDHDLIPCTLRNFLCECFPHVERFKRIPLEDINRTLNDVWEGPGSLDKINRLTQELKAARSVRGLAKTPLEPVKTIDEYDSSDFNYELDIPAEDEDE